MQTKSHCPSLQIGLPLGTPWQVLPQLPQWVTLLERLTHSPPHLAEPVGQPVSHPPPVQTGKSGPGGSSQTFPQEPQFCVSLLVSTQAPLHGFVPSAQLSEQTPLEQTSLPLHMLPQPPQLVGSLLVSTQAPPQRAVPPEQRNPHSPWEQVRVAPEGAAGQDWPQPPQ